MRWNPSPTLLRKKFSPWFVPAAGPVHHEHWWPISLLGHFDRTAGSRQNTASCEEFGSGGLHVRPEEQVDCHSGCDDYEHP